MDLNWAVLEGYMVSISVSSSENNNKEKGERLYGVFFLPSVEHKGKELEWMIGHVILRFRFMSS